MTQLIFFLGCAVLLASAANISNNSSSSSSSSNSSSEEEDIGEYGQYNTWREAICRKNDQEMMKEMEACFQMEPKTILDASMECTKEAHPASQGKTIPFVNAACKDKTMWKKFDDCFEDYKRNPAFKKQMEISEDVEECYGKVFDKYALESLQKYLKDLSSEE